MLARALLLGLLALASISSQAWATGPAYYPPGGSGSGVVANTCSAGDFFSAVDAGGNFTCTTATVYAPTSASFITKTAEASLSGEFSLGTLTTGLLLNTVSAGTGTPSAYAGTSCTNQFPRSLDASGAATCASVANADLAGSIAVSKTLLSDGAGILLSTNTLSTASSEGSFITGSTSLPGTCSEGAMYQDTDSGGTELYVCTAANTWTKTIASTDNVATATALAANPSDCSANQFATTIAANGNLTCAQPAFTDISGTAAATQITKINSTSCTSGVQTAADGTVSCMTAASTPEYVSRVETAGGTIQAYGVVSANGTTDDGVIEAATTVTQILGCSQSGSSVTSTNPVEVAVAGVARCSTDASVVSGSLVKLGASGQFALGTTAEKTWGRALTDSTGASGSAYILLFDGAEGTIDHTLDLWTSIPDLTTNTLQAINFSPTADISSTGMLIGLNVAPTTSASGGGDMTGLKVNPTWTQNGTTTASDLRGVWMTGTYGVSQASNLGNAYIMVYDTAYTSSTASSVPIFQSFGLYDNPSMTMTAASGSATANLYAGVYHNPTVVLNSGGGATATYTLTDDVGLKMSGTYTKTAGTALNITTRTGLQYNEVVNTSSTLTNNWGVDIKALSVGTNRAGIRNADATVYTPCTDDISGNTDYLARPECTAVNLTAGAARDLTAGTDQIADGIDGQIVTYFFTGSNSITFDDADNLNLAAATRALSSGDTLTLLFSSTLGTWIEIGFANN